MAKRNGGVPAALVRGNEEMERVRGLIRASGDENPTHGMIREIRAAVENFKASYGGRMDEIEASLDQMCRDQTLARLGASSSSIGVDREYTTAFASYFRKGAADDEVKIKEANASGDRASIQASMSIGDNSSGGYLAPVEWDRTISKAQAATSPMRRLATVQATAVGAYVVLWNNEQWGSGWVGETAGRPATTTTQLTPIEFPTGEIYAMPAITQRLLDDAQLDLEKWLADEIDGEFNRQESIAFLSGDGINKPMGLLQYVPGGAAADRHPGGTLGISPSGTSGAIATADALIDFSYALAAPYRQNATWLMNSQTAAFLAKMKDGQGNLIWRESLIAGQPSTLLGRPVEIDEGMPSIAPGNLPIAFGDFAAGYLINDRIGTRVLRDPYTNKPFVLFYVTKRVGGGVRDPQAIRLMKIGE